MSFFSIILNKYLLFALFGSYCKDSLLASYFFAFYRSHRPMILQFSSYLFMRNSHILLINLYFLKVYKCYSIFNSGKVASNLLNNFKVISFSFEVLLVKVLLKFSFYYLFFKIYWSSKILDGN